MGALGEVPNVYTASAITQGALAVDGVLVARTGESADAAAVQVRLVSLN